MRVTQILTPLLVALATAACARQQASYYMVDPATQQPAAAPQPYAQPGQTRYAQAPATSSNRGLFTSPQMAQASYAQAPYAQPAAQQQSSGRGLLNTYSANRASTPPPAYSQPAAYRQQAYAQRAQPSYAQPGYAQQQQSYARQPAPTQYQQYQQQSYGTGGPYVPVRNGNPYAQARWY